MPEVPAEPPHQYIAAPAPAPTPAPAPAPARPGWLRRTTPATFLSGGYIVTFVGGPYPATGHGVELSLLQYLTRDPGPAVGPLVQLQWYSTDGEGHTRLNAGAEFTLLFGGVELMYAYRGAFAEVEETHGVTIGPFLSLMGVVHVAGRFTIALAPDRERSAGNEYGVTLGLKVPALIAGDLFTLGHGRPCAIDGRRIQVALSEVEPSPRMPGVEASLLAFWLRSAEQERTSVVAFRRLALSLAEREAPPELLAECLRAAEDEVRHAELSRRRAERLAVSRFEFEAESHWLGSVVAPSFSELALESLTDGCLGEGVAARILASAADESEDAELAAELREVAADEARHAELGWSVVAHCLERDREAVKSQLASWLATSAPASALLDEALLPPGHGALSPARQTTISEQVWSEVVLRLDALLS
jgi:hypothetical protein